MTTCCAASSERVGTRPLAEENLGVAAHCPDVHIDEAPECGVECLEVTSSTSSNTERTAGVDLSNPQAVRPAESRVRPADSTPSRNHSPKPSGCTLRLAVEV